MQVSHQEFPFKNLQYQNVDIELKMWETLTNFIEYWVIGGTHYFLVQVSTLSAELLDKQDSHCLTFHHPVQGFIHPACSDETCQTGHLAAAEGTHLTVQRS